MTIKTRIINYVLLPTLLLSPVVNAAQEPILPTTPEQWRSITEHDIIVACSITAQNHPGMFDANNAAFPDLLKQAKAEALTLSAQASGPQVLAAAISRFSTENS